MDTIDIDLVLASIDEPGSAPLHRAAVLTGRHRLVETLYAGGPDKPDRDWERWLSRLPKRDEIARLRAKCEAEGIAVLNPDSEHWPAATDDLTAPPVTLFVRGDASLLNQRSIGVVGARAATGYGTHIASEWSVQIAERGFIIVSGGAFGIDATAHRAALAAGGRTVAFLAGGLDRYYPAAHDELLNRVAHNGAVVSEVPPGVSPTKWRFLQRNRLIAANSEATLVVEAGLRSGSLNTVSHANLMQRMVWAVPGPIASVASAGCHHIIKEKRALLAASPQDIFDVLGSAR